MSTDEFNAAADRTQELLSPLNAAETALRACLRARGFDQLVRAHMERARAHILEAQVALNEINRARTVPGLVYELNRVEADIEKSLHRMAQHI